MYKDNDGKFLGAKIWQQEDMKIYENVHDEDMQAQIMEAEPKSFSGAKSKPNSKGLD